MHKKLIVLMIACLVVVFTVFMQVEFPDKEVRIHQHISAKAVGGNVDTLECIKPTALSATKYDASVIDTSKLFTHLPLVVINTEEEISGNPYYDDKLDKTNYTKSKNGELTVKAKIDIMDTAGEYNSLGDKPKVSSHIHIRARGRSSRWFDKKSYLLRTVNENDEESDIEIMGMEKNHEWSLHGPFFDKSLMRNYLGMNISGMLMDYAPDVRYCEVVINGEYKGLYVMMETVNRGEGRVDIQGVNDEKNISGYIVQIDTNHDYKSTALNNFTSYTSVLKKNTYLNLEYPGTYTVTPELKEYIERDISKFEKSLYSFDYDTHDYGFQNYVDVNEFVDYFILMEAFQILDTGGLSTFFYKDIHGKIKPCVWDFNNSCDNYSVVGKDDFSVYKFATVQAPWFWMMIKEEDFTDTVIARYHKLRNGILSDDYLENYIDETVEYLDTAIERNYAVWGYSFDSNNLDEYNKLYPEERNITSYDDAIIQLKTALYSRLHWLDQNIEVLKQYSHESAVKKYNH